MPRRYHSDSSDASALAKALHFEFSGKTAPNRFLKAAMTERLATWDPQNHEARGIPTPELQNVYKRWGEGGLGHILTGNIMIAFDQLEAPGNMVIPLDEPFHGRRFVAFQRLAELAKAHGSLATGQVSHPGRQTEHRLQPDPVSASDIQLEGNVMGMQFAKPHPASQEEIHGIIRRFTFAAEYLHQAGFDGIQLHGAHGYLLSQFLSQTTNKRTDQYGGSLRNRARIILEIAESIRDKLPASTGFILGIKVNSAEFQADGFTADEAQELCVLLEQAQFDFVELSGGTYQQLAFKHQRESTKKREAFFIEFAEKITPSLSKTKSYVTGGLKTVGAMTAALEHVDGVGLGRPVCQEFHLPRDIMDGKVSAAIEQQVDSQNFGLTNVIAGSQIRQVGKDQEPIDMSNKENVDAFMNDMGTWSEKMQEDAAKMNMYGYVDIESMPSQPYGESRTSVL